jgi:hypothetical protein
MVLSNDLAEASRTPECFNGEDVSLVHALISFALDERHLFVAVNFVAQDVVAREPSDGLYWNGFTVEFNFVTLHYLLDDATYVVHASVDAGFL